MRTLKKQGYQIYLLFLWLKDIELAIARVKERVRLGGHLVPEETIRRRYRSGIKNFFNLYQPHLDHWQFYDNSHMNHLSLITSGIKNEVLIENKVIWKQLLEKYYEQ